MTRCPVILPHKSCATTMTATTDLARAMPREINQSSQMFNQGGLRVLSVFPRRPSQGRTVTSVARKAKNFNFFEESFPLVRRTSMTSSWGCNSNLCGAHCLLLNVRIDNTAGQPRTTDHLPMPTHSQPLHVKIIYFPRRNTLDQDFQEFLCPT